jgi:hypothetical protein
MPVDHGRHRAQKKWTRLPLEVGGSGSKGSLS